MPKILFKPVFYGLHLSFAHQFEAFNGFACPAHHHQRDLHCATIVCYPFVRQQILAQLRALLKDELFYREGTQLIATPYALSIAPVVHGILASMNGVIHQGTFQPESYSGSFSLAMRESTFEVFAPLFSEILGQTPQVSMSIYAKEQHGFDSLLRGQVDFLCCRMTSASHRR